MFYTKYALVKRDFLKLQSLLNKGLGDGRSLLLYPDLVLGIDDCGTNLK